MIVNSVLWQLFVKKSQICSAIYKFARKPEIRILVSLSSCIQDYAANVLFTWRCHFSLFLSSYLRSLSLSLSLLSINSNPQYKSFANNLIKNGGPIRELRLIHELICRRIEFRNVRSSWLQKPSASRTCQGIFSLQLTFTIHCCMKCSIRRVYGIYIFLKFDVFFPFICGNIFWSNISIVSVNWRACPHQCYPIGDISQ